VTCSKSKQLQLQCLKSEHRFTVDSLVTLVAFITVAVNVKQQFGVRLSVCLSRMSLFLIFMSDNTRDAVIGHAVLAVRLGQRMFRSFLLLGTLVKYYTERPHSL